MDWLVEILKAVLVAAGTIGAGWLTLRGTMRNSKVAEADAHERNITEALKAANESWEKLTDPLFRRVDELSERVRALEERERQLFLENQFLKGRVRDLEGGVDEMVTGLSPFNDWLRAGAVPPPPDGFESVWDKALRLGSRE